MSTSHLPRFGLVACLSLAAGACASAPSAFERADAYASSRKEIAASADRSVCPVVVSNATDQQLDASYSHAGVQSVLGLIPAGRSLSFGVQCDGGSIEAYAVASTGGLLGGPDEYRTVSAIAPAGATRVDFTMIDRVR